MPDTPQPASRQLIDLTRETDVAYWCRIFDVTIDQLRDAVQHAGHEPSEVQRHLSASRPAPSGRR
ncbi:DUF3606 domain-containing protein [Ramlibacter sp.]|uniref:DUF3606 domain-containing protein n=1 Tax=Ramlibacter sp. TaxID=1917967 RepID=UPI002C6D1BA1|nr:DUF3606 domain-containing protein [Ramlibacter sp.]HWI83075.1 DUF3606 domain-containing protein [Ramlibacter sp.]